jgi:hypothetical protein
MTKLLVAATAALMLAAPAFAEEWDFVLVNGTGKAIKTIELSPGGAGKWVAQTLDPDVKREPTIKSGARTTVHFDKGSSCKYDVKLTFADDSSAVWSGINVCDNSYITVKYTGTAPAFTAS